MELEVVKVRRLPDGVDYVTIAAKWEGIVRYKASFRKKRGEERRLRPFNKQFYNEQGILESEGWVVSIPPGIYHSMKKRAYAIIFDPTHK